MAKETITIDQLAKMINEGFRTTATKDEVAALHSEMNQKFEAVESRLDGIENLLQEEQTRKIENLDARMKKLEDALAAQREQDEKTVGFGAVKLGDMKPEHLDQLTNKLRHRPGRKHVTLTGARMNTLLIKMVRSILDLSYAHGYMPKNPHGWVTKQREEKPDIDPCSFDEMVTLLGVFSEPKWVRYYTVAFGTGARTSELIALQWPHVDFQRKLVHIRQGFVNGRFTTLKADGGAAISTCCRASRRPSDSR